MLYGCKVSRWRICCNAWYAWVLHLCDGEVLALHISQLPFHTPCLGPRCQVHAVQERKNTDECIGTQETMPIYQEVEDLLRARPESMMNK